MITNVHADMWIFYDAVKSFAYGYRQMQHPDMINTDQPIILKWEMVQIENRQVQK